MKIKRLLFVCIFLIIIIISSIIVFAHIRFDDEKIRTISINIKNNTGFDIKKVYVLNEYDEKDEIKETNDEESESTSNGKEFYGEIEDEWIELLGDTMIKNGDIKTIEIDMRKKGNGCEFVITKDEENEYIMEESIGEDILQDDSNIIFTIENGFLIVNEADESWKMI